MPDNYITLSQLTKTTKGLVNKINTELTATNSRIGDLTDLDTTAKTNLVAAINELAATSGSYDDTELVGRVEDLEDAISGLSGAMHFVGVAQSAITDGGTENPGIAGYSTKAAGDVVLYNSQEFVWTGVYWELLGDESSYVLKAGDTMTGSLTMSNGSSTIYGGSGANFAVRAEGTNLIIGDNNNSNNIVLGLSEIAEYTIIHQGYTNTALTEGSTADVTLVNSSTLTPTGTLSTSNLPTGSGVIYLERAGYPPTSYWMWKGSWHQINEADYAEGYSDIATNLNLVSLPSRQPATTDTMLIQDSNGRIYHSNIEFDTTDQNKYLRHDGKWSTISGSGSSSIPMAASNTLGGIKTGYVSSGKNYKVNVDTNGNAYVNVPWTYTNTTYTFAEGSIDGAFSVTPLNGSAQSVPVHGLAAAAYKGVETNDSSDTSGLVTLNKVSALIGSATSVTSVNGQIGAVTLTIPSTAADVGALPDDTTPEDIGAASAIIEENINISGSATQALEAGTIYHFLDMTSQDPITGLTITLVPTGSDTIAQYHFDFDSGSTPVTLTLPQNVIMPDDFAVEANKHYEIDILNNYGVVASWTIS